MVHHLLPSVWWLGLIVQSAKRVLFAKNSLPSRTFSRRVRRSLEWKRLEAEVLAYHGLDSADPHGPLKFLRVDFWRAVYVERVIQLGLHDGSPLKILDLGTGPGFFPFMCGLCGHEAVGLDRPLEECSKDEALVYSLVPEVLGVRIIRKRIDAFTPLAVQEAYDLITAFMICFNDHKRPGEWERPAWEFFLRDVVRCLRPGGRLCLAFNFHDERYGSLRFWSAEILELFRIVGDVSSEGVVITTRERITAELSGISHSRSQGGLTDVNLPSVETVPDR